MRVLIVEDNPEKYYDVKFALSQLGIADLTLVENANDATLTVLEQKENETKTLGLYRGNNARHFCVGHYYVVWR